MSKYTAAILGAIFAFFAMGLLVVGGLLVVVLATDFKPGDFIATSSSKDAPQAIQQFPSAQALPAPSQPILDQSLLPVQYTVDSTELATLIPTPSPALIPAYYDSTDPTVNWAITPAAIAVTENEIDITLTFTNVSAGQNYNVRILREPDRFNRDTDEIYAGKISIPAEDSDGSHQEEMQNAIKQAGKYRIEVTDADGKSVSSGPSTLEVFAERPLTAPEIKSLQFTLNSQQYHYQEFKPGQTLYIHQERDAAQLEVEITDNRQVSVWLVSNSGLGTPEELPAVDPKESPPTSFSLTGLEPGEYRIYALDKWSARSLSGQYITVAILGQDLAAPAVLSGSSHKFTERTLSNGTISSYEHYLNLRGSGFPTTGTLEFPVFKEVGENFIYNGEASNRVVHESNGFWKVDLNLPKTVSAGTVHLFPFASSFGKHAFGTTPLAITISNVKLDKNLKPIFSQFTSGLSLDKDTQQAYTNKTKLTATGLHPVEAGNGLFVVALNSRNEVIGVSAPKSNGAWSIEISPLEDGENVVRFTYALGSEISPVSSPAVTVDVRTSGPQVVGIDPPNFGTAPGVSELVIKFDAEHPLDTNRAEYLNNYVLIKSNGTGVFTDLVANAINPTSVSPYDPSTNSVSLTFDDLKPDIYQLRVNARSSGSHPSFKATDNAKAGIKDIYGNPLRGNDGQPGVDYIHVMSKPASLDGDAQFGLPGRLADVPGIPNVTGPPVDYREYTDPREYAKGFNPSDKVVTRVARLYYFRDAHRVVQILNRRAKSYNRHNTTMSRQLADQARLFAEEHVDERRASERKAVEAASSARQAENSLQTLQDGLTQARQQVSQVNRAVVVQQTTLRRHEREYTEVDRRLLELQQQPGANPTEINQLMEQLAALEVTIQDDRIELENLQTEQGDAEADVTLQEQRINATLATIESLREREVEERESMHVAQAKEDRAVERQFRLEVAAAKEDPDTYAAGIPDSDDPVAQVSLTVIGEGLIQLRGPMKGVNIVRTMINQIDSPVGQVRVGIHTVQVNGEKGEEMEEVVGQIGRYIDHSRFLTSQSAQMLRNAVVYVASQKAQQVSFECPPGFQVSGQNNLHQEKYLEAFFGREFIQELRRMDSEFLKSENKLLSLHSMDSTSLASALFLLGLASNETRMQILSVFEASLNEKLPIDEITYYESSDPGCVRKKFDWLKCKGKPAPFVFMADNAKFVSFKGYFNHQVIGDNTINPVQREFIRLAQIFKSRLITEIELKQRVMERALIEERIGDYQEQLESAFKKEAIAQKALQEQQESQRIELLQVLNAVQQARAIAQTEHQYDIALGGYEDYLNFLLDQLTDLNNLLPLSDSSTYGDISTGDAKAGIINGESDEQLSELFDKLGIDSEQYVKSVKENSESAISLLKEGDINKVYDVIFKTQVLIGNSIPDGNSYKERFPKDVNSAESAGFVILIPKEVARDISDDGASREKITFTLSKDAGAEPSAATSIVEGNRRVLSKHLVDLSVQIDSKLDWLLTEPISLDLKTQIRKLREKLDSEKKNADEIQENVGGDPFRSFITVYSLLFEASSLTKQARQELQNIPNIKEVAIGLEQIQEFLFNSPPEVEEAHVVWTKIRSSLFNTSYPEFQLDRPFQRLLQSELQVRFAKADAESARRPLDHKKFLDLLIDETEEKFIELVEGTRAHTAVMDDYIKRLATSLEDDFNTQFYEPAFRNVRESTYSHKNSVELGQIEHTTVLTNNREFAKVTPQATMEFDLPKRDIVIKEAMDSALAAYGDYGALLNDPNFMALTKMFSGQPTASPFDGNGTTPLVRDILPGLPSQTDESLLIQSQTGQPKFASQLEALIPDPAVYKFETGTGFEIRPVMQPDGQSVVFDFNYMYTTNVREPVRADEKHLGRVKRHFVDTDVQISNYELREVSRYRVALKAARTARGIPLVEDIPIIGILGRPLPSAESSLQQNVIYAQTVIYPTLFDLMGLRWAPAVADLDTQQLLEDEFVFRKRMEHLKSEVYDYSSYQVDDFLRIPEGERRPDLYRPQRPIPRTHPNGYNGPGLNRSQQIMNGPYNPSGSGMQFEYDESDRATSEPQRSPAQPSAASEVRSIQPSSRSQQSVNLPPLPKANFTIDRFSSSEINPLRVPNPESGRSYVPQSSSIDHQRHNAVPLFDLGEPTQGGSVRLEDKSPSYIR